jgi:hypothetical protein
MNQYKIRNEIVNFPESWSIDAIMIWVNAGYIRTCPNCSKIDVSYNHFNTCNTSEQRAIQMNRDMNQY